MPPKVKFSKETMIGTALQLVREKGMASLTAGALEKLGATPRVIFGQFANMSELQAEVIIAAEMVVVEYIRKSLEDEKPFRYVCSPQKSPNSFNCFSKILARIRFVAFKIFFP